MPALPVEVTSFLTAVTDKLKYGQNAGARSSASIGSGANGTVVITALNPGTAGNSWTVAVVVGAGTAPLSVGISGSAITVTLATNTGTPVTASNTAKLVAAALNANTTFAATFTANVTGTGASSLSTAVSAFALTGGVAQDANLRVLGANYLAAQDTATVLELFQNYISNPTVVTANGGSTTTATFATATTASAYIGATVTFASNTTTAALRNVTAVVKSNTTTALTFTTTLPGTVVSGDTFTIQQTLLNSAILELRGPSRYVNDDNTIDARSRGDSPPGEVYGFNRTVLDALERLCEQLGTSLTGTTISGSTIKCGTGSTTTNIVTNTTFRIDELKGFTATISGASRVIIGNNETTIFLEAPLASAPSATTAIALVTVPGVASVLKVHPGGQPGNNTRLAQYIAAAQTAVAAFVVAA